MRTKLQISIGANMNAHLKEYSRITGMSVSSIISAALVQYMKMSTSANVTTEKTQPEKPSQKKDTSKQCGSCFLVFDGSKGDECPHCGN